MLKLVDVHFSTDLATVANWTFQMRIASSSNGAWRYCFSCTIAPTA
jgi:hypothetical protein